jgi:hypothetical protein
MKKSFKSGRLQDILQLDYTELMPLTHMGPEGAGGASRQNTFIII